MRRAYQYNGEGMNQPRTHPPHEDQRVLMSLIAGLPKVELHMHIEGSLEPELMFTIAARNAVSLKYESVEAVREAYRFGNLQSFLSIYYEACSVLLHEQDFYDLTLAYLQRAHAQHVVHTEIFFDPQCHTQRGVAFATVLSGIRRALVDELVKRQVPLTVCPLSNVKLGVFPRLEEHNLREMLHRGLCVTVNSDDPAYFGGYIAENFVAAQQALHLTASEIYHLSMNAIQAAFLPAAEKQALLDQAA